MARAPLTRSEGISLVQKAYAEKFEQKCTKHRFFKPSLPFSKKKPPKTFTPGAK
jgi:hypothetical protein